MDRVAHGLHLAALDLTSRIFASLPWTTRVSLVLASLTPAQEHEAAETANRLVYALFLKKGVEGLPPPPPGVDLSKDIREIARHLDGYNPPKPIGPRLVTILKGNLRMNSDEIEDTLNDFWEVFFRRLVPKLKPGAPLHEADGFIQTALRNLIIDKLRSVKRKQIERVILDETSQGDEDHERPADLIEDIAFERFVDRLHDRGLTEDQFEALKEYVSKHVHPDMGLYLEYLVDGKSDKEILGFIEGKPKLLPTFPGSRGHFSEFKEKKLFPAIGKFLADIGVSRVASQGSTFEAWTHRHASLYEACKRGVWYSV